MSKSSEPVAFTVENLDISYSDQIILDNASLTIHQGESIGLVGRNGCGKSTFLRILAGEEDHFTGNVILKRGIITGFLPQEFDLDPDKNIYQNILDGLPYIVKLLQEYKDLPQDSPKSHLVEEQINHYDAWNLDYKIDSYLDILSIPGKDSAIHHLSGGEKRRVALARALIGVPDLLLLDEPTNHLDTESIEWLENYLQNYKGACVFVTHDRYFLDRVSSGITELSRGKFYSYTGNYSDFLKTKSERNELEEVLEHKRQRFLKKELEWVRKGAKARTTKAQFRVNRYYEAASQSALEQEQDIELIIPPPPYMGNKIININDISMEYDDRLLFNSLSLEFSPGDKIGILGKNGVGKTTLLKIITGQLQPTSGTVEISPSIKFNYIDQERIALNDENTVLEEIGEGYDFVQLGNSQVTIWAYLKRFLFPDDRIKIKVGSLSGGERNRLMLAKILKQGGNFIVLDEPTNDLDLSTLRILEEALINFNGCVVVVSHDRFFLNHVCTGILAFESDGKISYDVGNYDYYIKHRKPKIDISKNKIKKNTVKQRKRKTGNDSEKRKLTWKEKNELEGMEEKIMEFETRKEEIETLFSDPDFYKTHGPETSQLQAELTECTETLDTLYSRWEELEAISQT